VGKLYIADNPERVKRCELLKNKTMSSHRQILYQIVFGTKNRKPTIEDGQSEKLYKYIWGIVKEHRCKLYRINGVADHIHIASDLHPSISLADYIKNIKVASSLWLKGSTLFPQFEGWQDGYGAFTYSIKEKDILIEYIKKQKVHHQSESFYDEYKRLLVENGVQFDERYLL
jgi:REP element-mobilizing transposase RayT